MSAFFAAALGPEVNPLNWSSLFEAAKAAGPRQQWSVPEAFVAILFGAVTCDGELAPIEHEELLALAHRSRALKSLSVSQLSEINARVIVRLRDENDALHQACAALPNDARLSAFAHALDLLLADGELNEDEADFLNTIILALKLDRQDVERVAEVITLKNRF